MAATPSAAASTSPAVGAASTKEPLLVRAARGETTERPPVWMMRQAGRYMKVYQELAKKHPSFRERSEVSSLSTEISLQPWEAFRPDGVILFSDILTPLPGMGVGFDIPDKGPVISPPLRSEEAIQAVHALDPDSACPFVGQTLRDLRAEVGDAAAVLGFVGAPYTLATYCIEGGSSKSYSAIKKMAYTEPALLHSLLTKFADNIAQYCCYQIESGAQAVQMFDSWAGQLSPVDYDLFAGPYQKSVVDQVKAKHPDVPFIIYISQGGCCWRRWRQRASMWSASTGRWIWPTRGRASARTWACRATWTRRCCSAAKPYHGACRGRDPQGGADGTRHELGTRGVADYTRRERGALLQDGAELPLVIRGAWWRRLLSLWLFWFFCCCLPA
eukprot:TRINITY_DN1778_c0_g1_i7.p1 TRINITY_DN1778_c0_g1~~TRINITY_DN1778_c0_g1_i7.p1  ORF type:complete len:387 (-),score=90.58 TRINITY_DN1778_c0_g1_i7:2-1162(-)